MKILLSLTNLCICFLSIFAVDGLAQPAFSPMVRQLPTKRQMPVANVNEVMQDSEGYMWYATYEGGLCRDDGYHIDVFRRDQDHPTLLSDNLILSLCEAKNGEIWFSTSQSVYALDKHDYSIKPLSKTFSNIRAQHISRLPNGNMLVESDSVAYEVTPRHQIVSSRKAVYRGRFRIICPDADGRKWVCYDKRRICYTETDTSRVIYQYNIKAKNMLVDRERNLLFAITQDGLQAYSTSRGLLSECIYQYSEVPEIGVFGLYLDHRNNLWMTGYQPSFTLFTSSPGAVARKLNIKSPAYGDVYVDRMRLMPDGRLRVYKDIQYVTDYDLSTDTEQPVSDNTLSPKAEWRGNKRLMRLIKSNVSLDELLIKDAAIDGSGHLWVVFDQYVREQNIHTGHYRDIAVSSCSMGMYNFNCIVPVKGGVCVGGAGGACLINTNKRLDGVENNVPICVSSYILTSNDGTAVKRFLYPEGTQPVLELSPHDTNVTLCFTTFNHLNAPAIDFTVMIEGWTDGWVSLDTGDNTFRIINLPKGDYEVLVRATDEYGIWSTPRSVLTLRRLPAWWETWWAYTIYTLLVLTLIAGIFLLYRFVHKKREEFYRSVAPEHHRPSVPYSEFREKAVEAVKQNINDDNYSVDTLSEAMCMSRVNLYRKMLAECGQTPSEFIKTIRMEHAYQLLTTTDLPVNIIAAKCGFTSSSYFAKCFKSRYNVLPTIVRKQSYT